jgi:hypothetical protein
LKEKDQALTVGVALSKIRAFFCFHIFQEAVANTLKEEGPPKVGSSSSNHLREIKIILKCDVDGMPTLPTEITLPEEMIPGFQ